MKRSIGLINLLFVLLTVFALIGCAPAPTPEPTSTPVPPTFTSVPPTFTSTPEPTATSTPLPICHLGETIKGTTNSNISVGYIDIVEVSTSIEGTKLTVVFTLKELPEQITINKPGTPGPEIAWGVAIDVDNNPDTGAKAFMTKSGSGYDVYLQAFHFRDSKGEKTDKIDRLFRGETFVWIPNEDKTGIARWGQGNILVDVTAKTITLSGNMSSAEISDLTPDSVLYFYAYAGGPNSLIVDELCQR
ncbi:MAG: hypothetical protein IH589_11095 [Anaerolineales bacterium]|nr:hypothetical protein [Anaerolineales bacterium]